MKKVIIIVTLIVMALGAVGCSSTYTDGTYVREIETKTGVIYQYVFNADGKIIHEYWIEDGVVTEH